MHGTANSNRMILQVLDILTLVITMIDSYDLLRMLSESIQMNQHLLSVAAEAASSHDLKSALRRQSTELNLLDDEIQKLVTMRGLDIPELDPATRWWCGKVFLFSLTKKNTDSSICEKLILSHTKYMIAISRAVHVWEQPDTHLMMLQQKNMDWNTVCIRQLLSFL